MDVISTTPSSSHKRKFIFIALSLFFLLLITFLFVMFFNSKKGGEVSGFADLGNFLTNLYKNPSVSNKEIYSSSESNSEVVVLDKANLKEQNPESDKSYLYNSEISDAKRIIDNLHPDFIEGFEPMKDTAIYEVFSFNEDVGTISIEALWPKNMKGKRFVSVFDCQEQESQVIFRDVHNISAGITKQEFFSYLRKAFSEKNKLDRPDEASILFYGLCKDENCLAFDRGCLLSLPYWSWR
jgi:hypothetical protein